MNRREFITLLSGAAAWPLAARAQQPRIPVIGFLTLQSRPLYRITAFRNGLAETGYIEGQNVAVEYRFAEHNDQLPALTIDLVSRRVNVIFAADNAAVQAAKPASIGTPIVFSIGADPVALGLVGSLNRPGGNITGASFLSTAVMAKLLQLLHEAVPNVAVIAALINPNNPQAASDTREVQEAARVLKLDLLTLSASNDREIEAAFATMVERRAKGLLVEGDGFLASRHAQISAQSALHSLPTISRASEFPREGGLMGYGASVTDADRQAAVYVGRILKGEKPADLPVQQATKVEFVINLRTAKRIGLTVPPTLLALATEVIE
jgi:putative ABC transport system substrate-binding protein